ncbi:hypothetical protein LP414_07390 [Polaromonas sp. P1(28)-13]|nr:hypothetical protein LP414_07390 [Polaromonas sp. P1(28)-13]
MQIVRAHDAVDEAEIAAFVDRVVAPGEHHLLGPRQTHLLHGELRPAPARHRVELDLGKAEARRRRGDDEVAGQRELETPAERIAIDHRDGRLGELVQALEDAVTGDHVAVGCDRVELRQCLDVVAGHERLAACPGDDHGAGGIVGRRGVKRCVDQLQQSGSEGIELVGAVDSQESHRADLLGQQHGGRGIHCVTAP